ncbi:hypothetical protein Pan44_43170 [Caulifigura coniformis]|uniref:DUF4350 domain-containing protein n=1 Tax=Caulifigura coniformis TaxID=2527983 RepID=A0A517SJH0_9PLAN|nr:hypothetical protein [Caulifigura coniformis]QDT56265.1 hypothetical protein Pan44_43170 [Caulifigura coniformis]
MRAGALAVLCAVAMACLACPETVCAQTDPGELAINVGETLWGFDGKAVADTFTPLSILVQNTGPKSASGTFRLQRGLPLDVNREPPIEIPFEVPPFEERWIQAAPYIVDDYIPWQLSWGRRENQKLELPQARLGEAAAILLVNPNDRARSSGAVRRFRSNLFPATITVTDGLQTVFLNSVPDIQGARLQTFLEWLNRGGRVILLQGDDHQFPRFPSTLAALNNPEETFAVGSGQVRRMAVEVGDIDEAQLHRVTRPERPESLKDATAAFRDPMRTYNGRYPWSRDRAILERLESVSRFHRRWWLIYPLALLYLLAVFPGTFAVAHSRKGVKGFYLAYFATAVVFSWAFKTLGGVGGGDKNRIRSATIAQQIAPGVFDCSQWSSLAAVNGGWFTIGHEGSGRLYSPCEEFEMPHGQITSGTEARYEVDIPVASTRSAVSRFRTTAPAVGAQLRSLAFADRKLSTCAVEFEGLPAEPISAFACHREGLFKLQKNGDVWMSGRQLSMATAVFISNLDQLPNYSWNARGKQPAETLPTTEFFHSLERPLVGNAFRIRGHVEPWSATMPAGRLRVMALVENEGAFAPVAPGFEDVQGCVLYVIDLPVSEN